LFDLFFFLLLMDGRIVSLVAAGEVAGGSFVGDGLDGPTMLLPSGTAWFAVPEAARIILLIVPFRTIHPSVPQFYPVPFCSVGSTFLIPNILILIH
jgi:hypothetical protein